MMYQANQKGDEAATSIPYQKVEGCIVQKEGVIVIHFRPKFHAQIGTKQKPIGTWEVKLKDANQVPNPLLQPGAQPLTATRCPTPYCNQVPNSSNPTTAPVCIGRP